MSLIVTNNAQFILPEGENLLDALEHTGHEVEYQCREGYCGSCRTKIRKGADNVQYEGFPLAFVAPDEILPCCCQVTGQIEIDCTQEKVPAEMQPELFPDNEDQNVDGDASFPQEIDEQDKSAKAVSIKKPNRDSVNARYPLDRAG